MGLDAGLATEEKSKWRRVDWWCDAFFASRIAGVLSRYMEGKGLSGDDAACLHKGLEILADASGWVNSIVKADGSSGDWERGDASIRTLRRIVSDNIFQYPNVLEQYKQCLNLVLDRQKADVMATMNFFDTYHQEVPRPHHH